MTTPTPRRRGSSIAGAAGWQTLAQFAPLIVNLALTPFVIGSLGRVGYGLWLVTSTFTQFIGQVDGGIGRTALRYFSRFAGADSAENRREAGRYARSLTLMVLGIGLVILVPPMIFAGALADFFHTPPELRDDTILLLRVSLVLVGVGLWRNILAGILNAHQRYALTSLSNLASFIAYALALVITLNAGMGLRGMAYAYIAQGAVATLVVVPSALRLIALRGVGYLTGAEVREFFSVAWKVQISGLLTMLSFQGVTLIVGRAAPREVSDFGPGATFAQQLRTLPLNAVRPMQSTMGATIGREGSEAGRVQFRSLQRVWVVFVAGWVAIGAPAAMNGVNTWLPLDGHLAGQVAGLLMVGHLFALLPQVLSQWLMLEGHPEAEMWSAVVSVALTLALSVVTVGPLGALGVAVSSTIGAGIAFVVLLVVAARQGRLPRNPVSDVPWLQAIVCGAATLLATGWVADLIGDGPLHGGIGLLLVAAAAAPFFALYLVWTIGPRRAWRMVRTRSLR